MNSENWFNLQIKLIFKPYYVLKTLLSVQMHYKHIILLKPLSQSSHSFLEMIV